MPEFVENATTSVVDDNGTPEDTTDDVTILQAHGMTIQLLMKLAHTSQYLLSSKMEQKV
jgi:hypothetical protein